MSLEYDKTMTEHGRAAALAAPPVGDALAAGTMFAHFEIEKRLGKGGMGEVYLARDTALDRPVALKVIDPDIAQNIGLRERFYREARSQARIHHSNVCHIYYIGEDNGRLFFAMEYVEGPSLQQLLEDRGKLPPGEAIELCRQVALALREAWTHGFTHRDIKPSNLMLDRHGTVKVVDFGIVKQTDPAAELSTAGTGLTAERSVLGTPFYLSPEQARGDAVNFRADIYSLGATLHELIAGEPPFRGTTAMKIISQHLADPRPRFALVKPRKLTTGPLAIEELVDRMMAKSPEARFASYDELIGAMDAASPARVRPGGLFVRGFALTFDAMVVFSVGNLSTGLIDSIAPDLAAFPLIDTFAPILFLLYWIILHARWGGSLGKRLLEIRVEPARGDGRLGWRRAALRFVALFGPIYLFAGLADILDMANAPEKLTTPLQAVPFVLIGLYAILAGLLSANKRMYWDRIAGTQVRYIDRLVRVSPGS